MLTPTTSSAAPVSHIIHNSHTTYQAFQKQALLIETFQ